MAQPSATSTEQTQPARRAVVLGSTAVGVCTAVLLVFTANDYGLTFDEPVYIESADRLADWFHGVFSGQFRDSFRAVRLEASWVFARPENRNLPVPVLLSCVGHQLGRHWLGPLRSYRIGHCLLMALTLAIVLASLSRSHGWEVGLVTVGSLLLMPRVFAHAHLNATDVPVSCFWIMTILAWLRSESSGRGMLLAALASGLGMATKATFVLLPALLILWAIVFRRWTWWRAGVAVLTLSPLVMILLCPMWWSAPLERCANYFCTVFGAEGVWKIEVYYLGKTYILGRPDMGNLPWHNGLVLPAVTTPPWTLVFVLAAVWMWLRVRDASTGLWIIGAGVLPFLRMLPNTPGHDGVRLMMPSLFCLAPLAGFGFAAVMNCFRVTTEGQHCRMIRGALIVLLLAAGVVTVGSMHPCEMSYYSEAVGGLAGASQMGFEVSYWFEALSPQVLAEIQQRLPPGARVWMFPQYHGLPLLRQWGMWRPDLIGGDIGQADYLVLYSRKSRFYAISGIEQTYERGRPIWSYKCRGVQVVGLYKL